jgi:predicted glycoside hydrolase/deacetylase ChbG (UPF0249 family)
MCHSVNMSTVAAMESGVVTSASILVPCPWFPEIAEYARTHPDADFGIHLTLTSEWEHYRWGPVLPRSEVPSLVDAQGYLWKDTPDVAGHVTAEDAEKELRTQIQRALEFGVKPTHIDTHMGSVYSRTDLFQVYVRLAQEFSLPLMVVRPSPELLERFGVAPEAFPDSFAGMMESLGFPLLDSLLALDYSEVDDPEGSYTEMIESLGPGVTQLIVHCGFEDAELKAVGDMAWERDADYKSFTSEQVRQLIDVLGITLIGWRELEGVAQIAPLA